MSAGPLVVTYPTFSMNLKTDAGGQSGGSPAACDVGADVLLHPDIRG